MGTAAGPLICAPSSEIWGRRPVIHISNILFVLFTLACALAPNLASLFVFRFIAGAAGSCALTVGGGVIGDTIPVHSRGKYVTVFAMGGTIGPSVGPAIGGFLGQAEGWRWTFWLTLIIVSIKLTNTSIRQSLISSCQAGFLTVLCFAFFRESYAPALLKAKAKRYLKDHPDVPVHCVKIEGTQSESAMTVFQRAYARPFKILFLSPIAFLLAIYQSLLWGYIYLLFTTYPLIFGTQYGWSTGLQGLSYLALGIGNAIAMVCIQRLSDRTNKAWGIRHHGGTPVPEGRLLVMTVSAPLVAVGFFWYGWAAQAKVHWIVPLLGNVVLGFGILGAMLPTNLYMIDYLTRFAASALSGSFFLRSLFGGLLPLAGGPLFARLGVGWGASLLGFIALAMAVLPFFFLKYGALLREKYTVSL